MAASISAWLQRLGLERYAAVFEDNGIVLAPQATIVMTGEEKADGESLLSAGANHVLIPGEVTGERILELLREAAPRPEAP